MYRFHPKVSLAQRAGLSCNVRVDHGRLQTLMTQQQLNRADIDAAFQQMGCETVPEGMAVNGSIQAGGYACLHHRSLQRSLQNMVPADTARSWTVR